MFFEIFIKLVWFGSLFWSMSLKTRLSIKLIDFPFYEASISTSISCVAYILAKLYWIFGYSTCEIRRNYNALFCSYFYLYSKIIDEYYLKKKSIEGKNENQRWWTSTKQEINFLETYYEWFVASWKNLKK